MPGLPGSNIQKDLKLFKQLFLDERFKPDQLKIYPCQVLQGSGLEEIYWKRKYKPYTKEKIEKILIQMLKIVPRYCRVMRIMREIPPDYLVAGTTRIDLRKEIEKDLRENGSQLKEIRFREVGFNNPLQTPPVHQKLPAHTCSQINKKLIEKSFDNSLINSRVNENERGKFLKLKITKYKASGGEEYFLEIINKKDILFGLLRLRIYPTHPNPNLSSQSSDIKNKLIGNPLINSKKFRAKRGKLGMIRELHVYGKAISLGKLGEVQHRGLGKWLMSEAEKIVKQNKIKKLAVISGVGVREYYRKLKYRLEGSYMVKKF